MRRLTRHRRDRGAAATWVALLIVPMLVIAALGIDVGMMQVAKQRLQTGADAAALAIATQCARGICTGPTNYLAAQDMATANAPLTAEATATVDVLDTTAGYVEVTTTATNEHFFGPIAGIDSTEVSATAGARWGYPERGTVVMPLSISYCELAAALGLRTITNLAGDIVGIELPASGVRQTIGSAHLVSARVCLGNLLPLVEGLLPGGLLPGLLPRDDLRSGFLFLNPERGCTDTFVEVGVGETASTGTNAPSSCRNGDFERYIGQTVYLPIHVGIQGAGRNTQYQIYAFVAFTLHGYRLSDTIVSSPDMCPGSSTIRHPQTGLLVSSPNRCIDGTFELELGIGAPPNDFEFGPDAPAVGDPQVQLVLPEERP